MKHRRPFSLRKRMGIYIFFLLLLLLLLFASNFSFPLFRAVVCLSLSPIEMDFDFVLRKSHYLFANKVTQRFRVVYGRTVFILLCTQSYNSLVYARCVCVCVSMVFGKRAPQAFSYVRLNIFIHTYGVCWLMMMVHIRIVQTHIFFYGMNKIN